MPDAERLAIKGYEGLEVPNSFYRQRKETDIIAIIFPGLNYNCKMPLLHQATLLLFGIGADVLCVDYSYSDNKKFAAASEAEQEAWIQADATAAYKAAFSQRRYGQAILVGKSLGTFALATVISTQPLPKNTSAVWLTPLFEDERFRQLVIENTNVRSLFVIGTKDSHYNTTHIDEIKRATNGKVIVIEGADHGLRIRDDDAATAEALEKVMLEIKKVSKAF